MKNNIKVVARTLEVTKTVKRFNIHTSNFSVSQSDLDFVQDTDTVNVKVFDESETQIGSATFTSSQWHGATKREKKMKKSGRKVTFWTLPYTPSNGTD